MKRRRWSSMLMCGGMVTAGVLVAAPGCNSSSSSGSAPLAASCSLNSDCNSPLVCVFARCHRACNDSGDCAAGQRCVPNGADGGVGNVCQLPAESTCSGGICPGGEVCGADGQCRASCAATTCLMKQTCVTSGTTSTCYDTNNGVDATQIGDASTAADGAGLSDSGSGPDSTLPDGQPAGDAGGDRTTADSAPWTPNADAGPLLFTPANFDPTAIDAGASGGDAGIWDGAPDWSITTTGSANAHSGGGTPVTPLTVTLSDGTFADLLLLNSFSIDQTATFSVYGPRPVIIAVLTTVDLQGTLDLTGAAGGAGGFSSGSPGPGAGQSGSLYPHSAWGGGSFCGMGGPGGVQSGAAAMGGPTYGNATLDPLVGGSAGGQGGTGGGGIQIVAGQSITIGAYGGINVGGQGGGGSSGGGSGGAILLEAPTVTVHGYLAANGGGGGGWASSAVDATATSQPAPGGVDNGVPDGGSTGGAGGAGTQINGVGGLWSDGTEAHGGGGGGGVGRIRINTANGIATITGVVTPALTTACATQGILKP